MLIYLCDDSKSDILRLTTFIENYFEYINIKHTIISFTDSESLIKKYKEVIHKPDLIFMDIYMQNTDGMEAIKILESYGCSSKIIFVTSSIEHAIESYKVNAIYYLHKPYSYQDFSNAMKKCGIFSNEENLSICVSYNRTEKFFLYKDIMYVESGNHCSYIHTFNEVFKVAKTLSSMSPDLLKNESFVYCGKSFIINLNNVTNLTSEALCFSNNDEVHIPVRSYKSIKSLYLQRN